MFTASDKCRPQYEVADVFHIYGESFRATHALTSKQQSVMRSIEGCRTAHLGYHADGCDNCNHIEISYNSCRDRHCPKCQGIRRRKWVSKRLKDLLPIPYYHVVFTLPEIIFPVCLFNQKLIYNLLFNSAAETLLAFGRDPKWLGAEIGFFGTLHTWGQQIPVHLHLHFVVSGGGIDSNGCWVSAKYKDKFLFPVRALSKVFRAKFIEGLRQSYDEDRLEFPGSLSSYRTSEGFEQWIQALCIHQWIVYSKAPFAGPQQVVEYVGRYTHRVAISNHRIRSIDNGRVTFSYKDYADNNKIKETALSAHEFIKRFLFHVLPQGFHKIRHYGFLANGRKKKLQQAMEYLATHSSESFPSQPDLSTCIEDGIECPVCGKGTLRFLAAFLPHVQFPMSMNRYLSNYSPGVLVSAS